MPLYAAAAQLDFALGELPVCPRPRRVLMADPAHFDVLYAINVHMRDAAGALKHVDRARAREQWQALADTVVALGLELDVVEPLPGHPDLVFCANQVLPLARAESEGARGVCSRMAAAERRGEVEWIAGALGRLGLETRELAGPARCLEGTGDGLFHPGRRLLWAGVGPRSSRAAWEEIARDEDLPVLLIDLAVPDFYHLDTALSLLDEHTLLWVPEALDASGRGLVEALFERRIEADPDEARELLAANAWCPDGRHVLMQSGAQRTRARLVEAGYIVREVETGEFLKAGGSVFCMKLAW